MSFCCSAACALRPCISAAACSSSASNGARASNSDFSRSAHCSFSCCICAAEDSRTSSSSLFSSADRVSASVSFAWKSASCSCADSRRRVDSSRAAERFFSDASFSSFRADNSSAMCERSPARFFNSLSFAFSCASRSLSLEPRFCMSLSRCSIVLSNSEIFFARSDSRAFDSPSAARISESSASPSLNLFSACSTASASCRSRACFSLESEDKSASSAESFSVSALVVSTCDSISWCRS